MYISCVVLILVMLFRVRHQRVVLRGLVQPLALPQQQVSQWLHQNMVPWFQIASL